MSTLNQVPVVGSERTLMPGAKIIGPAALDESIEVTVRLRSHQALPSLEEMCAEPASQRRHLSREDFAQAHGSDPQDHAQVEAFAKQHGLRVTASDSGRRSLTLAGTVDAFSKAFGVKLENCEYQGTHHRERTGPVHVPPELADIVEGVFGLDNRPQANPHIRILEEPQGAAHAHAAARPDFTPLQLAKLYNFVPGANGQGECIGIIELGGGFRPSELQTYFSQLGITPTPQVVAVSVDGGQNQPGLFNNDPFDRRNADGEVMLDIEVAGAIAPKAKIVVYFAPNSSRGFLDAITTAVHDNVNKPSVISISWGGPESALFNTKQHKKAVDQAFQAAATMGVTVCVASGDDGSTDGVGDGRQHVDFPSSSPFALACGGTHLESSNGTSITKEVVWNDVAINRGATGGGISDFFPSPPYQANAHVPPSMNPGAFVGRGVPDVSGDASAVTGYRILADGQSFTTGGTSAVAPLWAGLIALLNQKLGHPVGFIHPALYAHADAFRNITVGNNGAFNAAVGWDGCTGLGSPDGVKLLQALGG